MNQFIFSPLNALYRLPRLGGVFDNDARSTNRHERNWVPRVDIRELDARYKVLVDIPGIDPKSIDITVDKNVLTIKGSRSLEAEDKGDEGNGFRLLERATGTFLRQFTLPETADGSLITASANNGVLEISIPKTEESKPLTILVNA